MKDECVARQSMFSAWLDGRLSAAEAAECAEHLEGCERCRAVYQRLSATRELLRAVPRPEAPAELLPAILAGIERELAAERSVVEMLHVLPQPRPPRELLPAIVVAAETEFKRERGVQAFWARRRVAAVAVAAAAAILLAVLVPHGSLPRLDDHQALPMAPPGPAVAVAPVEDGPAAPMTVEVAEPTPRAESERRVAGRSSWRPTEAIPTAPPAAEPEAPIGASEPVLAMAPIASSAEALAAATPIAPGESTPRAPLAPAPRNTPVDTEVEALVVVEASELAAGIIAHMAVEKFVSEHLIASAPTLLAVVTDVPSSQLGSALAAEDEDSGFGLCFTESMRRALSASENQFP